MAKIVLISCVSMKLNHESAARDLYVSPLFCKNLRYAEMLNPDKIFILSAKYELLGLNDIVEPYNKTLNTMSLEENKKWADLVLNQLKEFSDFENDDFVFLAGNNYRRFLIPHLKNYSVPMEGLGIGKQLQWLTKKIKGGNCRVLHRLFDKMEKHSFPFDEGGIPKNGIYVLFEKGEMGHSGNRVVRVGTHTGVDQLRSRLFQYFLNENKDRSIFRKNIGRALLNKRGDSFLDSWELDLTTLEAKEKYSKEIDFKKQKETEGQVTRYIQDNFSFVVFPVGDKVRRLEIESKIISTVSNCKECFPSAEWLGNFSPKDKIKKSGLWLVNELWKEGLSDDNLKELENLISVE